MIEDTAVVRASPKQVSATTPGEAVILDAESNTYFGLAGVGERVWELVQSPIAFAELRQTLQDEYDVAPDVLARDLAELVEELAEAGLVLVDEPDA